jgi:rhodanese-related sulfurtransferase
VASITGPALLARIDAGAAPAILDVRTQSEFAAGHVPGAVHVPFWKVLTRPTAVPVPPTEPVVVYCGHGPRARMAGAALERRGFRHVLYLDGHMSAWIAAGLPQAR